MARLSGLTIAVAGAGVTGLASALALARAGAAVSLIDPQTAQANASEAAAGMLAPAMETLLDPVSADHFDLYRRARDLWTGFLPEADAGLIERRGALWLGDGADEVAARLRGLGAEADVLDLGRARALSPGLAAQFSGVFTPEDWRILPTAGLRALSEAFIALGGTRVADAVTFSAGGARLSSGEPVRADAIVLATGWAGGLGPDAPPELAQLSPIKGQIVRIGRGLPPGPAVRTAAGYVVPGETVLAGATMEAGRTDTEVDPSVVNGFEAMAATLFPSLAGASATGVAGVRPATPDGLPLVGASRTAGLILAVGARRNGWLLAPMTAEAVVMAAAGEPPPSHFRPDRFLAVSR